MTDVFPHLHIILLCEEQGARLWPIANDNAPSCLAPEEPGSQTSLLAATIRRVAPFTDNPLHVVTAQQFAATLEDELLACPELAHHDVDMLVSPLARGNAFAVALAAARIRSQDPSAVIAVFPTNQKVEMDDRWQHTMYRAYLAALQDKVVVLGSQQERKCADCTYIHKAGAFEDMEDTYTVRSFVANAPVLVARRARREGALWYTGIIFARAAVLMGEMARAAELGKTDATRSSNRLVETANFFAALGVRDLLKKEAREIIATIPELTLDKALLETCDNMVVLSTSISFSTVTGLLDLEQNIEPDSQQNRTRGNGTVLNSRNTTVYAQEDGRKVVALGMRDCIIVDTGDTVLVAHKDHLDRLDTADI